MYDIRQFKPALYLLVFLGLCGFAAAARTPGLWLVGTALWALSAMLVYNGVAAPLPRWAANCATLLAAGYVALRLTGEDAGGGPPILTIGQFLVALQVIKLYEQKANRDFGQLIVLSLLLVVAAVITTPELWFGVLLVAYLFLSLYCCLLFHLKVETDAAKKLMGLRDDRPGDLRRLRQDQRRLSSSMRRLTAVVSLAAVASATVVFLVFPRGSGGGFIGGPQFKAGQAVTGFSGSVSFQDIARITQNTTPVAYLELLRDGRAVEGGQTLYLRGNTLDVYVNDPSAADRWTWASAAGHPSESISSDRVISLGRAVRVPATLIEQRFEVEPVGMDVLLALPGAFQVASDRLRGVNYSPDDGTMSLGDRGARHRLDYTVWSTGELPNPFSAGSAGGTGAAGQDLRRGQSVREDLERLRPTLDRADRMRRASLARVRGGAKAGPARGMGSTGLGVPGRRLMDVWTGLQGLGDASDGGRTGRGRGRWPEWRGSDRAEAEGAAQRRVGQYLDRVAAAAAADPIYPASPALLDFALDPAVSGRDAAGRPLARDRLERPGITADDERIARNMERYLQQNYRYSLDVTDARRSADQDPLDWFVGPDGRRGHCEYFAGTLAGALQALGIPARVVVGFKSDEFNPSMGRYVVRQSHAHAWVEALTRRGWQTLDPTSGNGDDVAGATDGPLRRVRQWLEFLQYSWANSVVAYDNSARESLIQRVETGVADRAADGGGLWDDFQAWLERQNLYVYSAQVMAWLIVAALATMGGAVTWFLFEQWRLRRVARRMGLRGLPPGEARRLARQLTFYDDLTRLLGRHGFSRPASQTPREFAGSLSHLPGETYGAVVALTEIFYRVRYGQGRLTGRRQRLIGRSLDSLAASLEK